MTVTELMQAIVAMWPRTPTTWTRAWGPIYQQVLGRHEGEALAAAWRGILEHWSFARPPAPADLAKHLPESTTPGPRQAGQRGEPPLPFGQQHFAVCKAMADELLRRWLEHHRQWLPTDDPASACAIDEAGARARHQAMLLAHRGHRDAPEGARIDWAPRDWDIVRGRATARQTMTARLQALGPGKLRPLHVAIGADGRAVMVRDQADQVGEPPAWLEEAPLPEEIAEDAA